MTVTKIEYRGSGFYGNRPTRIIKGEWHPNASFGGDDSGFVPAGFHPVSQDEIGAYRIRRKEARR